MAMVVTYSSWKQMISDEIGVSNSTSPRSRNRKDKWNVIRPDVPIELSDKYHIKGKLLDGVYAEIHKSGSKYMIPALETK
eukprot:10050497-Prorocentrum_lima.AAC.1